MLTFFLWLGWIGAIMAATGTIGYRIYSSKLKIENDNKASSERKEIKDEIKSSKTNQATGKEVQNRPEPLTLTSSSSKSSRTPKEEQNKYTRRVVIFADNVNDYPNLLPLLFEASKPWFPSGKLNGDSNAFDLSQLIEKYDVRDLEAIRKYALEHEEAPLIGWIFIWCTDDGKSLHSASFTEETYKRNTQHPYKYSVLSGDIFGYDPDNKESEVKFIRKIMEENWGEADRFDVAISFASEQREYARELATYLREKNIMVFFDEFEQTEMWGEDGLEYLENIYTEKSDYVIMLLSQNYVDRAWPTYERKQILGRQFLEQESIILPVSFDNVKIPGLPPQIIYLNGDQLKPNEVGAMAKEKIITNKKKSN